MGFDIRADIALSRRYGLAHRILDSQSAAGAVGLNDRLREAQEGSAADGVRIQPILESFETILYQQGDVYKRQR